MNEWGGTCNVAPELLEDPGEFMRVLMVEKFRSGKGETPSGVTRPSLGVDGSKGICSQDPLPGSLFRRVVGHEIRDFIPKSVASVTSSNLHGYICVNREYPLSQASRSDCDEPKTTSCSIIS